MSFPSREPEARKAYREANKERIREYKKQYYLKNRERLKARSIAYYAEHREERMKAELETKNTEAEGAIYDAIRMPIPERIERALALIVEREAIFEARMAGKNGGRTAEDCIKSARWYLEYASDEHDVVNALKQVMIAKYLEGKE